MCAQPINVESLPTTSKVASSLIKIFNQDDIDLRDITAIALQDAVVLMNVILLVNKSFQDRDRPVVNTVQAAINLLGLPALREQLLSIKKLDDINVTDYQKYAYKVIRNRIYTAANITNFWANYMGEKNIEELYCASMFTGVNQLHQIINQEDDSSKTADSSYLDSIDGLQTLYRFEENCIQKLPDSIQQVFLHSSYTKRLSLSVIVYELITALELGYATPEFMQKLQVVIEFIDQSASRATYDLACQIVQLHRDSPYLSYNHAAFLIATNSEALDPLKSIH